jgi:hypothetical protein
VEWARASAGGRPLPPQFASVTADLRLLSALSCSFALFAVSVVDGFCASSGCSTDNLGYHGRQP